MSIVKKKFMQDIIDNQWRRSGKDICQMTGYYWPHINFGHRQLILQGEKFPNFESRQVSWFPSKSS